MFVRVFVCMCGALCVYMCLYSYLRYTLAPYRYCVYTYIYIYIYVSGCAILSLAPV